MIEWLAKNSEWVFSGIGAAAVTAFLALLGDRFRQKQRKSEVVVRVEHTSRDVSDPDISVSRVVEVERISPLSAEELQASIESAPLLQQEVTAQRYIGQRIEWDSLLAGAETRDGVVLLQLRARKGPVAKYPHSMFVWCNVKLEDYRELALLTQGTPIRVRGTIEKASSSSISLADARLSFLSST